MINKIDATVISDALPLAAKPKERTERSKSSTGPDASVQVKYAGLLNKAMETPQDAEQAVARIKEMLASGQLDTPENIHQAAENMLEFGI